MVEFGYKKRGKRELTVVKKRGSGASKSGRSLPDLVSDGHGGKLGCVRDDLDERALLRLRRQRHREQLCNEIFVFRQMTFTRNTNLPAL